MADQYTANIEASKDSIVTSFADLDSANVEEIKAKEIQQNTNFLRSLRRGEEWLDAKLGVETQGIDRIPEEEKRPPSMWNTFFLWWSLNVHVANLPAGMLGPQFGLSLRQSVAASVVGTLLGSACMAFTGTLGPKVGLRFDQFQNVLLRFNDSWDFVKLPPPDILLVSGVPNFAPSLTL